MHAPWQEFSSVVIWPPKNLIGSNRHSFSSGSRLSHPMNMSGRIARGLSGFLTHRYDTGPLWRRSSRQHKKQACGFEPGGRSALNRGRTLTM